MTVSPR